MRLKKNLIAFTTRPDTLFGVTYLAVSINHDLAVSLSGSDVKINEFVLKYRQQKLSEETSAKVEKRWNLYWEILPSPQLPKKHIPIWIANYVLDSYGTGVVMGVPHMTHETMTLQKNLILK